MNMTECSILDTNNIKTISKDGNGTIVPTEENIGFFFKVLTNNWITIASGSHMRNKDFSKNPFLVLRCQIAVLFARLSGANALHGLTFKGLRAMLNDCRAEAEATTPELPTIVPVDHMAAVIKLLIEETNPKNPRQICYCPAHERFFPCVELDIVFSVCIKCTELKQANMNPRVQVRTQLKELWNSRVPSKYWFNRADPTSVLSAVPVLPQAGMDDLLAPVLPVLPQSGMKAPRSTPIVCSEIDLLSDDEMLPPVAEPEEPVAAFSFVPTPEPAAATFSFVPTPEPAAATFSFVPTPEPAAPTPEPAAAPAAPAVPLDLQSVLLEIRRSVSNTESNTKALRKDIEKAKKRGRPALVKTVEAALDPHREMRKLDHYFTKPTDHYNQFIAPLTAVFQRRSIDNEKHLVMNTQIIDGSLVYFVNGYRVIFDTDRLYSTQTAWILVPIAVRMAVEANADAIIVCTTPDAVVDAAEAVAVKRSLLMYSPMFIDPNEFHEHMSPHHAEDYFSTFNDDSMLVGH